MSIRYDPVLTRALGRALLDRWGGARLRDLRLDRTRRAVQLGFEDGSRFLALLHPRLGHLAALGPDADVPEVAGDVRRFGRLFLSEAHATPDERALSLVFADAAGRPREGLALELRTNLRNALRLSAVEGRTETQGGDGPGEAGTGPAPAETGWRIEASLLARDAGDRSLSRGTIYRPPASDRRAIDAPPSEAEWGAWLADRPAAGRRRYVLVTWSWATTLNVDWILRGEAWHPDERAERGDAEVDPDPGAAWARYLEVRSAAEEGAGTWLHERPWGLQPYPHPLAAGSGREAADLWAAFEIAAEEEGGIADRLEAFADAPAAPADDPARRLEKRLRERKKRVARRVAALERQLDGASSPEEPRSVAQLLLVRKDEAPRGTERTILEGFDGSPVEVELDPRLDAVENAERLFEEARRRERALEKLPAEIEDARARGRRLAEGLERLEASGPDPELWELVGGAPADDRGATKSRPGRAESDERLPYARLRSSGGLEIRVGRGAKDNDDLTFHHSAPEDIWLHASQASGAHVILRWGRADENPPQRDLAEAAVAAAVHSQARHSGAVPVVWTRRKYVRKPRKSPPGVVVPDRVRTLFVEPDEEVVASLRAE